MRRIILPLIAIFLGIGLDSFSQGTECTTAVYLEMDVTNVSKLTCLNTPVSSLPNQTRLGTCTGGTANGRATWFFFVSDGTCPMLSIDGPAGTQTEVALMSDCITQVPGQTTCLNNGSGAWSPSTPLPAGNLYYLRIWTAATSGNIGICNVKDVAQEVIMDGTCTNIHLSPTTDRVAGNISSAAQCTGNNGRSIVWAKFHTTATNQCVTINLNGLSATPAEMVLYGNGNDCSNTIRNLSSVCYGDGKGVWSAGPTFPANLYTPNRDYYLRLYTNIVPGPDQLISLCGTTKTQAVNDLCSAASTFSVSPPLPSNNACAHYTGNTAGSVEGIGDGTLGSTNTARFVCASTFQNMVWYKFKVGNKGGAASVTISGIDCDSYNNNPTLLQMGLLTGDCGSLQPAITPAFNQGGPFPATNSAGSPTSCLATMNPSNVTLYTSPSVVYNQTVYLAIDGYNGANCKFNLQSIENIIPIPIILKYFTAWKMPGSNLIRWVTSSEHLNNYFEVERSLDGINFFSIGRVPGHVESTTDQVYDLEDKAPPALAYYRLKQVDIDEKYTYSETIMLKRNDNIFFGASMPNPVSNNARITISTEDAGMVMLRVMDGAGRQVISENVACTRGNNIVNKDFSRLPAGNYFLLVTQDSKRVVKSFIKQ